MKAQAPGNLFRGMIFAAGPALCFWIVIAKLF